MKTRNLLLAFLLLLLSSCTENNYPLGPSIVNIGVEYQFESGWEDVYGIYIYVSDQPNDFVLEFKSTGLLHISVSEENKNVKVKILDCLYDSITGEKLKPMPPAADSRTDYYLQRVRFETNGEKQIDVSCEFSAFEFGRSSFTLIRQ